MTPPPPFDPELAAVLGEIRLRSPATVTHDSLPELRRSAAEQPLTDDVLRDRGFLVREHWAGGPDANPVPLLVCLPTAAEVPVPVLYAVHGGGMVAGTFRGASLLQPLDWAAELGMALVSVDYRLAPEHPYPAPVDDCYAGLVWTVEQAMELGIDPDRVVVVGTSAGGGLAAAAVLLARDRSGPAVLGQILLSPMLDDRNDTPSAHQMAGLGVWDRASNELGWSCLLGGARGSPAVSAYGAPARAEDVSGLPPTFIDVGSAETFRDEAIAYASRIWQTGGRAELHVWPGGFHGFDMSAPHAAVTVAARSTRVPWLRRLLAGS